MCSDVKSLKAQNILACLRRAVIQAVQYFRAAVSPARAQDRANFRASQSVLQLFAALSASGAEKYPSGLSFEGYRLTR